MCKLHALLQGQVCAACSPRKPTVTALRSSNAQENGSSIHTVQITLAECRIHACRKC